MILMRRRAVLLGTDVLRENATLRRPGLRIYASRLRGCAFDTRACQVIAAQVKGKLAGWAVGNMVVPLDGELVVRREREVTQRPGELLVEGNPHWDERWEGEFFSCLGVEWDGRFGAPVARRGAAPIGARDRARLRKLHASMLDGDARGPTGMALARELHAVLCSMGVPLHPWNEPELAQAPPGAQLVADQLSAAFSNLAAQPMWVDFARSTGQSERQLHRRFKELGEWVELPEGLFRRRLRTIKAVSAAALLGAPGATVEQVARSVGYASGRALVLALDQEGLATPSEIRAALRSGSWPRR